MQVLRGITQGLERKPKKKHNLGSQKELGNDWNALSTDDKRYYQDKADWIKRARRNTFIEDEVKRFEKVN